MWIRFDFCQSFLYFTFCGNRGVRCEVCDCSFNGKYVNGLTCIERKAIDESGHILVVKNWRFDVNNQFKLSKQKNTDISLNYISINLKNQQFKSEVMKNQEEEEMKQQIIDNDI